MDAVQRCHVYRIGRICGDAVRGSGMGISHILERSYRIYQGCGGAAEGLAVFQLHSNVPRAFCGREKYFRDVRKQLMAIGTAADDQSVHGGDGIVRDGAL